MWNIETKPIRMIIQVLNFAQGSSTGQAPGDNSDVYLRPVAVFPVCVTDTQESWGRDS